MINPGAYNTYDYYSYFGARYYDSDVSVWLSVDPMADEAPGWTPYRYGYNNPIINVDPYGLLEDWFMNKKTGDVYYNSDMKKGDEGTGAMKGNNWVHMGENGMFNNSSEGGSDMEVNSQNYDLQTDYHSGKSSNKEAYYNGNDAEEFMDRMGSKKVKDRELIRTFDRTGYSPDNPGGYTSLPEKYTVSTDYKYIKKNKKLINIRYEDDPYDRTRARYPTKNQHTQSYNYYNVYEYGYKNNINSKDLSRIGKFFDDIVDFVEIISKKK